MGYVLSGECTSLGVTHSKKNIGYSTFRFIWGARRLIFVFENTGTHKDFGLRLNVVSDPAA